MRRREKESRELKGNCTKGESSFGKAFLSKKRFVIALLIILSSLSFLPVSADVSIDQANEKWSDSFEVPNATAGIAASSNNITVANGDVKIQNNGTATFMFYDDFQEHNISDNPYDGTLDGWTTESGANWTVAGSGSERYLYNGGDDYVAITAGDTAWTDYAFSADMRRGSNDADCPGLLVRFRRYSEDPPDYDAVYFGFDDFPEGGEKGISLYQHLANDGWRLITYELLDPGTDWHHYDAYVIGNAVYCYYDGNLMFGGGQAFNATIMQGKIGFWSSEHTYYDNISVRRYEQGKYQPAGNLTSIEITPTSLTCWDKFHANTTTPSGTNMVFSILNTTNYTLISGITATDAQNGYDISSIPITNTSIRLCAFLNTSNASNTPVLHDWNVSWDVAPAGICGDINEDEVVNMLDVIDLLYYVSYPGEYAIGSVWTADVNCDDNIDMLDVIDLLYYVSYPGEYELGCCES